MSPSALDQWFRQRSAFVGSYFEEKDRVDTKAMQAGRQIHRLIEGGMIPAKCSYAINEQEIKVKVPGTDFYFMGIPDSRTESKDGEESMFVDYKSGKANEWKEKLPTDIKMKATAWLVWQEGGESAEVVKGAIEFIQTTWDPEAKAVVPLEGKETEVIDIEYTAEELKQFTTVIAKAMHEVNEVYEKWKENSDAFVNLEDVNRYEILHAQKEALEAEMSEIKERIGSQMEFGGLLNFKSELGTFYVTERETYSYPGNLKINYRDYGLVLDDAEEIASATKAAMKNYELITEPVSVSSSVGFRPKKPAKKNGKDNR